MNEKCNRIVLSIVIGMMTGMIIGAILVSTITYKIVTNSFISQYDHELEVNSLAQKIDRMYRQQDVLEDKLEIEVKQNYLKADRIIQLEKRLKLDE